MLSPMAEANRRREAELRPGCVHLQCLRCGSEFMEAGGQAKTTRPMMLPEGGDAQDGKELMECDEGDKGEQAKSRRGSESVLKNTLLFCQNKWMVIISCVWSARRKYWACL